MITTTRQLAEALAALPEATVLVGASEQHVGIRLVPTTVHLSFDGRVTAPCEQRPSCWYCVRKWTLVEGICLD